VRHVWHWHETVHARLGWHPSLQRLYRRKAQQADTIICISRQQQHEWEQALDMPLTNARIVYNPIKRICPLKSGETATHTDVRIGFIGHFEPLKNIGMLVHCFESLHAQYPATSLWLCGAMNEQDCAYVEAMTDLREPILHILPQTNHVEAFYHAIGILVLPSWCETMPLVVMEAMQAGVCVLQTDRSGMKERIEDGKESLFFSPYEPESLLRLMERCMDQKERKSIATAGQKKAMDLVNNQSFDDQITKLICE
jgi:glycosyltransferase involved in cell wall biosynthesis